MSYCTNCGEEISGDQQFCSNCGERLAGDGSREQPPRDHSGREEPTASEWDEPREQDEWTQQREQDEWGAPSANRQPSSPGHGGQHVPRKNAIETITESAGWLFGLPILIGAFLAVDILNSASGFFAPGIGTIVQLLGLVLGLLVGGVAYVYVDYEFREGAIEFSEAVNEVTGQLVSLIGVFIIYSIAVIIGLILFIIPGIYLGARLFLAFPACVLDKHSAFDSISVSWDVAGGNVLKLIGIFLLSLVPLILVGLLGAGTAGVESFGNPFYLLVIAPVSAFVTGVVEMSGARVYLENRGGDEFQDQPRSNDSTF